MFLQARLLLVGEYCTGHRRPNEFDGAIDQIKYTELLCRYSYTRLGRTG